MAKGYWLLALLFVVLTGCKDKNSQLEDPFVIPGNVANPNWVVAANNNLPSSLTAIIKVSFAENEGILAAFIGGECCGVADYIDGLYWLYISTDAEAGGEVQLRFYSPDLKRIFDATATFPYQNDAQKGTVTTPYIPLWTVLK